MKGPEPNPKLAASAICVLPGKTTATYSTMFQVLISTTVCPTEEYFLPSYVYSTSKGSFFIIIKRKFACEKQWLQLCVFLDVLKCSIVKRMYNK